MTLNYYAPVAAPEQGSDYIGDTSGFEFPTLPAVPSYLVGADNHQLGNNGSSIFDPTTWGERADKGFKFSVSMLTRAVSSTYNSAVTVGSLVGLTDEGDKADTAQWLQGMDDDLAQYYRQNKASVDMAGDVIGMFAPGMAGVKALNWAQKSLAAATEGKAGLSLAAHFGTLPSKQAAFATAARAEISASSNTYSLINANLAKSLGTGYLQGAIEFAAFDIAASSTMKDSPLFATHDVGDIAYNALLGGGMIGAGIMGTATAIGTISAFRKAGSVVDEATHAYKTVLTEPHLATPASEAIAIHMNNVEMIPRMVAGTDSLSKLQVKAANATRITELDNARTASHKLAGNDTVLGNTLFDTLQGTTSLEVSHKMAGAIKVGRAGIELAEEAKIAARTLDTTALRSEVTTLETKLAATDIGISEYAKVGAKLAGARGKLAGVEAKIAEANMAPLEVQFVGLFGAHTREIFDKAPTLRIADKVKTEADVLATVATFKHTQGKAWDITKAGSNIDEVEARYIHAQEAVFNPEIAVGTLDIPYLERAYQEMAAGRITEVKLTSGVTVDKSALWHHLEDTKLTEANKILQLNSVAVGEVALTADDIAKMVNVAPSRLKGEINVAAPASDLFALQTSAEKFTSEQVALGNWRAEKGTIKTYLQPHYAKVVYDTTAAAKIDGHQINGMVAIKEQQAIYREQRMLTTDTYYDEATRKALQPIPGNLLVGANRESVGGGFASSQNGDYNTLASFMQQVGVTTANFIASKADKLADRFAASGHKILNDSAAGTEMWKTVQQLRMTPEKYTLVGNELVNIKVARYERELAEGADAATLIKPIFEDTKAPQRISLETAGMQEFAKEWSNYHKEHRAHLGNLRGSQGIETSRGLDDVFYVPPVDSRQYPHFAFVVDDTLTSTGHVSMLHANTPAELEALVNKVPTDQGLKVIHKSESERWHKAMKDYDYDLGINENYIDTALKKSGASAPYYAVTDSTKIWDDLMSWRKNQDAGLARDMLEHRYETEFAELRRQGAIYDLAATSRKGYGGRFEATKTANPYTAYIKSAMNVARTEEAPTWNAVNRLAETSVSSVIGKLEDTFKEAKTPAQLEVLNKELRSIGCAVYEDAATYALANHTAPRDALSKFIRGANSLLSFTMLRSDPMNALNNGIGHAVLYGTELPRMIKDVLGGGGAGAAAMSDALHVTVPGTASKIISPSKLASNAYGAWWDKIIGGSDGGKLYTEFKAQGLLPSYTDQFRLMADNLAVRGGETAIELNGRLGKAMQAAEKFTGNTFAEEMNRFVAAHSAMQVADIAIAAGKLQPELKLSVINTFVNRTQGVALAAQRPLMFTGPVGQGIGLFQTYQFNMLQQMFRYVGEGDRKSVATLLGLQGAIYGLNGLPAFNAMNNYLVGNAAGNSQHKDVVFGVYDIAGKEAGDWLMYGAASNFLIHPDAKINLYSRGDINPRQVTVIPTTLADVPIVGATSKFFGSIWDTTQKINKGADVWNSFLQGVEHSGVSRPLAGFAQVMNATASPRHKPFSTDNAGSLVMENELFSLMTASRLLGAKPLDEAVALDAFQRVQVYKAASKRKLENLGEAIKATVVGGNVPEPDQVSSFVQEYAKAGGNQQNFNAYYHRQVMNANKSKVNTMIQNTNTPGNAYIQKMMGGYELQDMMNTRVTPEEGGE